jgi:hypothetical protein
LKKALSQLRSGAITVILFTIFPKKRFIRFTMKRVVNSR